MPIAAVALLLVLATQDEPAQPAPPPADVCLSNACGPAMKRLVAPGFRSVQDAVKGGNAWAARDLGGSPRDAMDAILQRLDNRVTAGENLSELIGNIRRFADTSDGSSLSFAEGSEMHMAPDSGMTVVGSVVRRAPDGSTQSFYLTDNGGGIWIAPGFMPDPNRPGIIRMQPPSG